MNTFFENLEGIDIPEIRKKKCFANALWIQRNIYFRNRESAKVDALLRECAQMVRYETYLRDKLNEARAET